MLTLPNGIFLSRFVGGVTRGFEVYDNSSGCAPRKTEGYSFVLGSMTRSARLPLN